MECIQCQLSEEEGWSRKIERAVAGNIYIRYVIGYKIDLVLFVTTNIIVPLLPIE